MAEDRVIDLSRLPVPIPYTQLGTPLPDKDLMALPDEERRALTALFDQARALLDGAPLTAQSYAALAQQYARVKELGLDHYCSVMQIGARFRIDPDAVQKAQEAIIYIECRSCH